jgi:hypothetical protein
MFCLKSSTLRVKNEFPNIPKKFLFKISQKWAIILRHVSFCEK